MKHMEYAWNITPKRGLSSPWEERFGTNFVGTSVPLGALVQYMPNREAGKAHLTFQPKLVDGIFIGYHTNTVGQWTGDYEVMPMDLAEQLVAPQMTASVEPVRTDSVKFDELSYPLVTFGKKDSSSYANTMGKRGGPGHGESDSATNAAARGTATWRQCPGQNRRAK